ncbi:hypothetical protein [Psychrobacter sp. DM8]|uniref:hypothetical protein n=1 Tax=Psychrobacter sp. DM8 TaxID=3440636 RepID=UPI003F5066F5
MQNRTLSLLFGTTLMMPIFAFAATDSSVTPADIRTTAVDNTLQAQIEGPDGELLATQPSEIEVDTNPAQLDPKMMEDSSMMEDPNMMPNSVTPLESEQRIEGADSTTTVPVTLQETRRIITQ